MKVVSFADILRDVNQGRDESDRITHASLRVHVRRHYATDAVLAYGVAQIDKKLRNALDGFRGSKPMAEL
ncbi:hypothetical protein A5685_03190 [Mycobacterium colombiense]|uniref:Uncharacterized protein n=1 Tax=Mycobacterium colombiense TaxID=339268 RepID=A0A1A2S6T2_9MYCO|nr:hypothetical protein A5685_03190 [Mycobacterium colombiense]